MMSNRSREILIAKIERTNIGRKESDFGHAPLFMKVFKNKYTQSMSTLSKSQLRLTPIMEPTHCLLLKDFPKKQKRQKTQ